jgi:hypothetical protein
MYKILNENKIVGVVEQWTDNDKLFNPNLIAEEDTEHKVSDYVMVGNEFVLNTDAKAIEKQKENVRDVRNSYMKQYVDYYQEKPLMWAELDDEFKQKIIDYRQYLKDYPESNEEWYKENPKTFEEFKGGD